MRHFARLFGTLVVASALAGCDGGGIPEGSGDTSAAPTGQTDSFRKTMEEQSKNMKMVRPKTPPGAGAKPAPAEAPKEEAK